MLLLIRPPSLLHIPHRIWTTAPFAFRARRHDDEDGGGGEFVVEFGHIAVLVFAPGDRERVSWGFEWSLRREGTVDVRWVRISKLTANAA